jgi:putative ABC transport system permease protein
MNADTVLRKAENVYFTTSPQPRISVRFKSGNPVTQVEMLRDVWKEVQPGRDFDFSFLNDAVAAQYQAEQRTGTLVKSASVLSILIACMGLFGLVTLTVAKRTREIGIRKVLGSGVFEIVKLIAKEFIILIGIATILAFPVAAWLISDWLKDFAYHTIVGWQVYIIAAVVTVLIAMLTIAWQTVKAALMNPVKSLKTE